MTKLSKKNGKCYVFSFNFLIFFSWSIPIIVLCHREVKAFKDSPHLTERSCYLNISCHKKTPTLAAGLMSDVCDSLRGEKGVFPVPQSEALVPLAPLSSQQEANLGIFAPSEMHFSQLMPHTKTFSGAATGVWVNVRGGMGGWLLYCVRLCMMRHL